MMMIMYPYLCTTYSYLCTLVPYLCTTYPCLYTIYPYFGLILQNHTKRYRGRSFEFGIFLIHFQNLVRPTIRVSEMFFHIVVTWDIIQQLRLLLIWLWKWCTPLDCKMLNSPDTKVLLARFADVACSTAPKSTLLVLLNHTLSSRFLGPEQNFLDNLVTVLGLTAPSLFVQQMFLVASVALLHSSNS